MPNNENEFNQVPNQPDNNNFQSPVDNGQTENPGSANKPLIEIPKEYYEKLEQEKHEKAMQEQQEMIEAEKSKEDTQRLSKIALGAAISGLVVFLSFYVAYKIKDLAIFISPIVTVIITIFATIKNKKESTYHTSVLVGGMLAAVVAYCLCVANEETAEFWMHYAISCAIAAFVCFALCSIVYTFIANRENIKALGTIGIILFLAALIGVPFYFYHKDPEGVYRTVFMKTIEVKAETEFEFITKTMRNRYNIDFNCQSTKVKSNVQKGRKITERTCVPSNDKDSKVTVRSLTYDESKNQYIIMDNYLDILKFNEFRKGIANDLLTIASAISVNVLIYPIENCTFIGDCAECDEYYKNYDKETDPENQYNASSKANYEDLIKKSAKDIVNEGKYKYVFSIVGAYGSLADFSSITSNILAYLNKEGLKNNYGFEITYFTTSDGNSTQKETYKVKGEASEDSVFKNFTPVN